MQLNRCFGGGNLAQALGLLTANLFIATGVHAQVPASALVAPPSANSLVDQPGTSRLDSAVLFYQEAGGRVKAIEPVSSFTAIDDAGDVLSLKVTIDSLTGATPNGATPWKGLQTFTTPAAAPGHTTSVTGASGRSSIVTIPGTGTVARQYPADANTLPVDEGFHDKRLAIEGGFTMAVNPDLRLSIGGGASREQDYRTYSVNTGVSKDLNGKNTTLSLAANFEFDQSRPYYGTPDPLTVMSALEKGSQRNKTVSSVVAGVSQVINRYWLAQLSYNFGDSSGYQTDPYRILSVVDPVTGGPVRYLYESRPNARMRQSVYFGNKVALGPTFLDLSVRAYHDSWGVNSITTEISERIPITSWFYVEPQARFYKQTAANFYRDFLINGQTLPTYASSDSRLGKLGSHSFGLKLGLNVLDNGELYLLAERYSQTGVNHPSTAIGDLKNQDLFSGVKATSMIVGYTFSFY